MYNRDRIKWYKKLVRLAQKNIWNELEIPDANLQSFSQLSDPAWCESNPEGYLFWFEHIHNAFTFATREAALDFNTRQKSEDGKRVLTFRRIRNGVLHAHVHGGDGNLYQNQSVYMQPCRSATSFWLCIRSGTDYSIEFTTGVVGSKAVTNNDAALLSAIVSMDPAEVRIHLGFASVQNWHKDEVREALQNPAMLEELDRTMRRIYEATRVRALETGNERIEALHKLNAERGAKRTALELALTPVVPETVDAWREHYNELAAHTLDLLAAHDDDEAEQDLLRLLTISDFATGHALSPEVEDQFTVLRDIDGLAVGDTISYLGKLGKSTDLLFRKADSNVLAFAEAEFKQAQKDGAITRLLIEDDEDRNRKDYDD